MSNTPHSQTCNDLLGQITDYIDNSLEAELCAELEAHLEDCEDCRLMVDTTRKTLLLYQRHYLHHQVSLPEDTNLRLRQALKSAGCLPGQA